jgi:hypothetical protein
MKISTLAMVAVSLLAALVACNDGAHDSLVARDHDIDDPTSTAAGEKNTFDHAKEATGGENGITDVKQRHIEEGLAGSPADVAKMHASQKISYVALGAMLADFGVTITAGAGGGTSTGTGGGNKNNGGTTTTTAPATASGLYTSGKSALGAPVFSSRTPEMLVPSTSALAKQFDIFIAAAPDIIANIGKSKRCPGVVLVTNNQLTEDGISCLIGKPATADHVALANKLVTDVGDPTKGTQIAVATLLAAAHISE